MSDLILLTESAYVDLSQAHVTGSLSESETSDVRGLRITLPVCVLNKPTANNRIYTQQEMERALNEARPAIAGRRLLCAGDDHPPLAYVPPTRASHLVEDAWVEGDKLMNRWLVLRTENGKNLRALIEAKAAIGVSIRGLGRLGDRNEVRDYQYLGTDCVGNPAAGTFALPGSESVKIEVVESDNSLGADSYHALSPADDGLDLGLNKRVKVGSMVWYGGKKWRVGNVAGSYSGWQMTLVDDSDKSSVHVMSDQVKTSDIVVEGIMDSFSRYMDRVHAAAEKLYQLREAGQEKEAIRHIAEFECSLVDCDLDGDQLKQIQDTWDYYKRESLAKKKSSLSPDVREALNSISQEVSDKLKILADKIESIAPHSRQDDVPLTEVSEDCLAKINDMLKTKYGFGDDIASQVMLVYNSHRGDPMNFEQELAERLGSGVKDGSDIDYQALYDDIDTIYRSYEESIERTVDELLEARDIINRYNQLVLDGSLVDNRVANTQLETVESVLEELSEKYENKENELRDLKDKIDSGEYLMAERVQELLSVAASELKGLIEKSSIHEDVAMEIATEVCRHYIHERKKIVRYLESTFNKLVACEYIIEQLVGEMMMREGRITTVESTRPASKSLLTEADRGSEVNYEVYGWK